MHSLGLLGHASLHYFHARGDFLARNQRRPVCDNFAYGRAAFAESSGPGRTIEHQRNQFASEAIHRFPILSAHADADLDFGRIGIGRRGRAEAGIYAENFGIDLFEAQAKLLQTGTHDAIGGVRLIERLRPRIDERAYRLPAVGVAQRELQIRRARAAANAGDADAVRAILGETDAGEISDAIRRDVILRITQLIEELLLDRVDAHPAAG